MDFRTRTFERLRDELSQAAPRQSIAPVPSSATDTSENPFGGDADTFARFEAIFEATYLMIAADGKVDPSEVDLLHDAIREVSRGRMRGVHVDQLADECAERLASGGVDERLAAIARALEGDPVGRRAAYSLAAAVLRADGHVDAREVALLDRLGAALDLSGAERAHLRVELDVDTISPATVPEARRP